jgi:lysophospholipase L1-like esterase
MSPVVLHFGSGAAFFTGVGLLTVSLAMAAALPSRRPWVRLIAWIIGILGVTGVACSATPLPAWAYAGWAALFVTSMAACSVRSRSRKTVSLAAAALVAGIAIAVAEGRHHLRPRVPPGDARTLYVIGDSLSAGVGDESSLTWPELIRALNGVDVRNLSRAGGTTATTLHDLDKHPTLGSGVVLLEIGGNDQFGRTPTPEFEQNLAALLARVTGDGRRVILLELPLFPFNNGYGRVQRRLADEHGVTLIPKRYLVDVIAPTDATTDGVHLTAAGHRRMAEVVWDLIAPAFGR